MRDGIEVTIAVEWDEEASVWVATSEDVIGFVTEAATMDEIIKKTPAIVMELLIENNQIQENNDVHVPISLFAPKAMLAAC